MLLSFSLCLCQNVNATLFLQLPMKFSNVIRGNLTIFNKDHDTTDEGRSRRFLQPSIRLRYNYQVRILKFWSARQRGASTLNYHQLYMAIVANAYAWLQ